MPKTENIEVQVPTRLLAELQAIAKDAGIKAETVLKLALATEMRRWNRDQGVRAERDCAVDTLCQIAAGKRRTREQRLALSCVTFLDECSNVPPNSSVEIVRPQAA